MGKGKTEKENVRGLVKRGLGQGTDKPKTEASGDRQSRETQNRQCYNRFGSGPSRDLRRRTRK